MADFDCDTDSEDLLDGSWSVHKRRNMKMESDSNKCGTSDCVVNKRNKLDVQFEKFEELKTKSAEIMRNSSIRRQKTELRRSRKLLKRALKDPWIKATVENSTLDKDANKVENSTNWKDVKPYLSVNDHLQGPINHGDCGPKTELECLIDDCIKDGDFEKAELLSDTLANREFGAKIAKAFRAKQYKEKLEKEKMMEKNKRKKIRGIFDAKERWQMKGNM